MCQAGETEPADLEVGAELAGTDGVVGVERAGKSSKT